MRFFKMAVAVSHHHELKALNRHKRCKLQSFTQLDCAIINASHFSEQAYDIANFPRCYSSPCLSLNLGEDEYDTNPRIEIVCGSRALKVRSFVIEVATALACGVNTVPVSSGLGGAYFLCGRNGQKVAVAKPIDEEPLAYNNPKGFGGLMFGQPGVKRSIRVGEAGIRELAAYLLDHGGFAGVPSTALVKISHVPFHVKDETSCSPTPYKIASLQHYVDHDLDAGELGASSFSVASVHRIGILDVRLLNLDRHAGNMLIQKHEAGSCAVGSSELVPIDHGLCLPEWLDDPYFEWLHWPQASVPFSESELEYISSLDPCKDAELLRNEIPDLRESSIRVFVLCTTFLMRAVAAGLNLSDIGELMTRKFSSGEEHYSDLENLCLQCKANMPDSLSDDWSDAENNPQNGLDIIQFDIDTNDSPKEVLCFPLALQDEIAKPTKIPRFSSADTLTVFRDAPIATSRKENGGLDCGDDLKKIEVNKRYDNNNNVNISKTGGLSRSMTFSTQKFGNGSGEISFEDMSEEEWDEFLEIFENLLPTIIGKSKSENMKQRLGTSCEF